MKSLTYLVKKSAPALVLLTAAAVCFAICLPLAGTLAAVGSIVVFCLS